MFIPSPQQVAFIEWAELGSGSCVLEAVAGSGKTTAVLEAVQVMPGQSVILAYNRKIAEEIKAKLIKLGIDWKKAEAGTVHSFGLRAYRKAFPKAEVKESKVADMLDADLGAGRVSATLRPYAGNICHLVSLAKQRALGVLSPIARRADWHDIVEHFDLIDEDDDAPTESIVSAAIALLQRSNAKTDVIDFDDMVYLPLVHKVRFFQIDNVFVDEAQDTNPARRALIRAMVKPASRGGRVVAVGDRFQAIYQFSGACSDSLDLIAKDFDCIRLPLTITYRCPKAVVAFARQWVDHITAAASAPEGAVTRSTFEAFLARGDLDANSAVLCRNTKPLVSAAFALIRKRIPCRIEGREIGRGLTKLARRWKSFRHIGPLDERLSLYVSNQTALWSAKGKEAKAQEVQDQVATLRVIMDQVRAEGRDLIEDVVAYIEELFSDNVTGVLTLSTIHKSKGREWKRVFWLDRINTCPSKAAKRDWELTAETNLAYVAATRAMEELIDLEAPLSAHRGLRSARDALAATSQGKASRQPSASVSEAPRRPVQMTMF